MKRPSRDDYAPCDCARAREEGAEVCGGCEEYRAARNDYQHPWDDAAADVEIERRKDEDVRGEGGERP